MNKAQLIDALAERLGNRKTATEAVDNLVDVIIRTVQKGEKVAITGFGVFEKRARAARVARNPRTGETVRVKKTNVPTFRAGTQFKDVIGGTRKLAKVAPARATGTIKAAKGTAARAASAIKATPAKAASATKATASRATTTAKKATPAQKPTAGRTTTAKKTATSRKR